MAAPVESSLHLDSARKAGCPTAPKPHGQDVAGSPRNGRLCGRLPISDPLQVCTSAARGAYDLQATDGTRRHII